jgi:hypothetical protein
MTDCREVDPKNTWLYYNVTGEISDVQAARMVRFLGREHLWAKFLAEDRNGKRYSTLLPQRFGGLTLRR